MLTVIEAKELFYSARDELDSVIGDDPISTDESKAELYKFQQLTSMLMSYPHIRPFIRCVMVDANGSISESSEKELNELIKLKQENGELQFESIKEITAKIGGALYAEVEKLMINNGFDLTDRSGGCDGWSLGCHCTLMEAEILTSMLHQQFASSINNGILTIMWNDWTPRWKED